MLIASHSGVPRVSLVGPRAHGSGGRTGVGDGTMAGGPGQAHERGPEVNSELG